MNKFIMIDNHKFKYPNKICGIHIDITKNEEILEFRLYFYRNSKKYTLFITKNMNIIKNLPALDLNYRMNKILVDQLYVALLEEFRSLREIISTDI